LGRLSVSRNRYAATTRNGKTVIFELGLPLYHYYVELRRALPVTASPPPGKGP